MYNKIGDTLTIENLSAIKDAMSRIAEVDRSTNFDQFMMEIDWRLDYLRQQETRNNPVVPPTTQTNHHEA
jgi:hypothetical protein